MPHLVCFGLGWQTLLQDFSLADELDFWHNNGFQLQQLRPRICE